MASGIGERDRIYTLADEATAIRNWTRKGIPPPPHIATIVDNQFRFKPRAEVEAHNAAVLERRASLASSPDFQTQTRKRGVVANVRLAGASLLSGLGR